MGKGEGAPRRIHLGGEGSKGEEEAKHELLILSCIEGAKGTMPFAVEQAHTVPIEDVQHVGVVPRQPRQRPRRRRRSRTHLHDRRSPEELHLSRVVDALRWISDHTVQKTEKI